MSYHAETTMPRTTMARPAGQRMWKEYTSSRGWKERRGLRGLGAEEISGRTGVSQLRGHPWVPSVGIPSNAATYALLAKDALSMRVRFYDGSGTPITDAEFFAPAAARTPPRTPPRVPPGVAPDGSGTPMPIVPVPVEPPSEGIPTWAIVTAVVVGVIGVGAVVMRKKRVAPNRHR